MLIAVGGAVVLVGLGHRMVGRLILTDYGALYESYVRDAASVVGWLGSGFGWLIVALAVVGFVVGYRATRSEGLAFVAAFGVVLSAIWVVVVGQQDVHYAAHFVLPVVIGLAALAWTLWRSAPGFGRVAVVGLGALLAVNLAAGLTNVVPGAGSAPRTLLAAANPPLVRQDLDEMARLVADLRSMAGTTSPVLVIGSTDGFSDDTVVIADEVNRGDAEPLFVLTSPHVDSRDSYPLNVLLAADVVVVPDPLPLPLAPEKQGVQRVLHDLFVEGDPAVAAFTEVPGLLRPRGRDHGSPPAAHPPDDARGGDRGAACDARVHPDDTRRSVPLGQRRRVGAALSRTAPPRCRRSSRPGATTTAPGSRTR